MSMKTKYIFGCLIASSLFFGCSSIDSDQEENIIIITDKGLDIDDDKKFEKPGDMPDSPSQPNHLEEEIKTDEEVGTSPEEVLSTLHISENTADTTLFAGTGETIESHIVIHSGGILQIFDNHTMHQDASITIEQGGYLWVKGCLRQVNLTIKGGGTLKLCDNGYIILTSRGSLYLEPNAIIKSSPDNTGASSSIAYGEYNIYAPAEYPSTQLEKLDSLEIEQMIHY